MSKNHGQHLPIAIVGAACRLPGAVNVAEFWDLLCSGRHAVTEMPADRRESPENVVTHGGFLDQIDGFDAPFFDISPYEAVRIDPHHRLLMETVWEAMEDAGITAEHLAGSRTGVYTSCLSSHYWNLLRDADMYDMHAVLGAHRWSAPPVGSPTSSTFAVRVSEPSRRVRPRWSPCISRVRRSGPVRSARPSSAG